MLTFKPIDVRKDVSINVPNDLSLTLGWFDTLITALNTNYDIGFDDNLIPSAQCIHCGKSFDSAVSMTALFEHISEHVQNDTLVTDEQQEVEVGYVDPESAT